MSFPLHFFFSLSLILFLAHYTTLWLPPSLLSKIRHQEQMLKHLNEFFETIRLMKGCKNKEQFSRRNFYFRAIKNLNRLKFHPLYVTYNFQITKIFISFSSFFNGVLRREWKNQIQVCSLFS